MSKKEVKYERLLKRWINLEDLKRRKERLLGERTYRRWHLQMLRAPQMIIDREDEMMAALLIYLHRIRERNDDAWTNLDEREQELGIGDTENFPR